MNRIILESLNDIERLNNYIISGKGTLFENKLKRTLVDIVTIDNRYISIEEALNIPDKVKTIVLTNQITGEKLIKSASEILEISVSIDSINLSYNDGKEDIFKR